MNRVFLCFCLLVLTVKLFSNHLSTKINLQANSQPIEWVLDNLSANHEFKFSYNPDLYDYSKNCSFSVKNLPLKKLLKRIFGADLDFKEIGSHIILKPNGKARSGKSVGTYVLKGQIFNAVTGEAISNATILEVDENELSRTNKDGVFSIKLKDATEKMSLSFSKAEFEDTIINLFSNKTESFKVALRPRIKPGKKLKSKSVAANLKSVDSYDAVNFLIPLESYYAAKNINIVEPNNTQVSLIPYIGTNGLVSGSSNNNLSFNLISGYSKSLDGFEFGGMINLNNGTVRGVQVGGIGNINGGKTEYLQVGGLFNVNIDDFTGVQISGMYASSLNFTGFQFSGMVNTIWGDMKGLQLSGWLNSLYGEMNGTQVTGFCNFTSQNVDGFQVGGIANIALGDVELMQISGFANYCINVNFAQVGGFLNIAAENVENTQIAGFSNYAENVKAPQVAGFLNIAKNRVSSSQIGGFANYSRITSGSQIGGFLNISKDTVEGTQIGGGFNFSRVVENFQIAGLANISTQESKGTQIAGIFNYSKIQHGSQIALINYCDSIVEGYSIGMLSFVKNGYNTVSLYSSLDFVYNINYKMGMDLYYTILRFGSDNKQYDYTGLGFGSKIDFHTNSSISVEIMGDVIFSRELEKFIGSINRINIQYSYDFSEYFSVFTGVSTNFAFIKPEFQNNLDEIKKISWIENYNSDINFNLWNSIHVGLSVNL
jgi:hypothetical protein